MSALTLRSPDMPIKQVRIEPGCILCRRGSDLYPAVFEAPFEATTESVRACVDLVRHEADILEAADACPVGVIRVELG